MDNEESLSDDEGDGDYEDTLIKIQKRTKTTEKASIDSEMVDNIYNSFYEIAANLREFNPEFRKNGAVVMI